MKKLNLKELLNKIKPHIAENINKITQDRNKLILAVLAVVIILYLDFSFVLMSQIRALKAISPNIARLSSGLKNLNADLEIMQKQTGSVVSQIKKIASSDQISWVIEEISRLANQEEVEIYQVRPVRQGVNKRAPGKSVAKEYDFVMIDLELSAGYHQLGKFLAELENHSLLLGVEELDIEYSEEGPFEHKIKLRLKAYVDD